MSAEEPRRVKRIIDSEDEEDDAPVQTENNNNEEQVEDQGEANEEGESKPAEDEEEMDDLFGDDDGDDDNQVGNVDGDQGEENAQRSSDEEGLQFAVEDNKPVKELTTVDLDVVRHPPAFEYEDDKLHYAKIPNFLQIDPTRFDGKAHLEDLINDSKSLTQDEIELNKLRGENTIRWRYAKDSKGELIHESNAQVIEWSDGSLSLKLGDEYFDVIQSELTDTYLTTYSETSELLTTDGIFTNSMKLVPTSTNSKIHKKLTTAIQARQQTKPGAQSVYVDIDPEQEARTLEKQQDQLVRERRRKELKEQKEKERYDGDTPRSTPRLSRDSYYAQPKIRDEYEEDDFMVEDDEEEPEDEDDDDDEDDDLAAAERLRKVKSDGAAKYAEDEEEKAEEEDEDDDAKSRKKRRVIESDEDEE